MAYTYDPPTKFGYKDTLPPECDEKVIRGTDFDAEFKRIETGVGDSFDETNAGLEQEIEDRIIGDQNLQDQINNLDNSEILNDLNAEIQARIEGDQNLQDQIDSEEQARIEGDQALQNQVDGLTNYDDTQIKSDLEAEVQARLEGDQALQGQIDSLENYDDTQITADLATETQARIDGDAALQGQIDDLLVQPGAGMVISDEEPAEPVEGLQWLDSTTAEVWIWDGDRWLEFPAGSGGSSGGTNDDAVVQSGTEDQQVVSKFTFTANPTQDEMGFTNAPNKLVVDVDEKRTSFIAGSPNSSTWDSSDPWDVDIQGSLNIKALGAPYSDMQYTSNGLSNYGGSLTLEANGTANFSSQVKMMDGRLRAFLGDAGKEVALSFKKIDGLETIRMYSDESGNFVFRDNENYTNRLTLDASGNATVHGSVTATSPSNIGAPTSTIDPAILLRGGDSGPGEGGELGFGAFTNRKFAAIKGSISDAGDNGAGHLDFYTRENPNTAEMSRALRITSNGNATFSGSVNAEKEIYTDYYLKTNSWRSKDQTVGLFMGASSIYPTNYAAGPGGSSSGEISVGTSASKFKDGYFTGTVNGTRVVQDGSPVIDAKGLITTLTTLRNATKDETTLEGLRDSIGNAIGGLIEKFEAEIATMEIPE